MDWLLLGDNNVTFTINGKIYRAGSDVRATTSLNTYIREYANLKGTKYMCQEGGCGACIVTMTTKDPATGQDRSFAINSCLVPVLSCQGAAITTIEGIGNKSKGYHKIQKALYTFNGTQCGYCSPGQVMNMYSLLKSNPQIKMKEVENSFGGSICRCTGYRPILDAFKSLASDATDDLKCKLADIEDLIGKCRLDCENDCKDCSNNIEDHEEEDYSGLFLETAMASNIIKVPLEAEVLWYRVNTVEQIFQLFDKIGNTKYMLVGGNTAQGVYKEEILPTVYIDINDVRVLTTATAHQDNIVLGGNMTLTDTMSLFNRISSQNPLFFGYTKGLADHIDLVANVPVRNRGTLAGNMMIKHQHREFPSDIFLILETCGAKITIRDQTGSEITITLLEFLETEMNKKVILNVVIPALSSNHYVYRSFKIMPRKQNVHALVNAGFLFRIKSSTQYTVEEKPTIVFGAIEPYFVHATDTEIFLTGKSLLNSTVLDNAKFSLSRELKPNEDPPEASPQYRKMLAISLFYRFILEINGENANKLYRSGSSNLVRPLSSGKQEFPVNDKEAPVHQPKLKYEGLIQSSGEAEFIDDMLSLEGQLYGALVITDRARAHIVKIDSSSATKIPGVVAFYSAKDIPGNNSFAIPDPVINVDAIVLEKEELFCSGEVKYAGQPVGIIVATSHDVAIKAAQFVKIQYSTAVKPLLTIKEVLATGDKSRINMLGQIKPTNDKKEKVAHKIIGEFEMGAQYHYTMELQTCMCIPKDDGMDVYSSTQWMHNVQQGVANVLGVKLNRINMMVKRLGGAYGAKVSRAAMVASACALAAQKSQRPVRMVLDLQTNTKALGKRPFYLAKYQVEVDEVGKIQRLTASIYEDSGCSYNDNEMSFMLDGITSCYDPSKWAVDGFLVKTDTPSSVYARGPGTIEGITTIEHIMDHIATVCKKHHLDVRRSNFSQEHSNAAEEIIQDALLGANYEQRLAAVNQFNIEHRWKKRGIAIMPIRFGIFFFSTYYSIVSIFFDDGTVAITSGGIEMGQGINTKVAQVCAYALGIDMSMIQVKSCYNNVAPNQFFAAASITSDSITYATLKCCEELNRRLQPIKEKMGNPSWPDLTKQAYTEGVDLMATYMYSTATDSLPKNYSVFGAAVLETEVDILTGQYQILKAVIVEDAGESLSPFIDIGQVEGAFVFGLGYFSSEKIIYKESDGSLLTNRTWNYWPPGAKDIPIDFEVKLKKNASNPLGVLRSKTTGEPPLCLAFSLQMALRQALKSARKDAGIKDEWFDFNPPCTFENTALTASTSIQDFKL